MADRHHSFRPPHEREEHEQRVEPERPTHAPEVDNLEAPPSDVYLVTEDAGDTQEPEVPSAPSAQSIPSAHIAPEAAAPTLSTAFTTLCAAVQGHMEDNAVLANHCNEIQAWHANSGGDEFHSNSILAWRHAISMLEEVLGHSMTQR